MCHGYDAQCVVRQKEDGDPATYEDYSTFIGSIFCGGNVGSMTKSGLTTMEFNRKLVVFDKVVGGCNNAYVAAKSGVNAEYNGGIIGATDERTTYLTEIISRTVWL